MKIADILESSLTSRQLLLRRRDSVKASLQIIKASILDIVRAHPYGIEFGVINPVGDIDFISHSYWIDPPGRGSGSTPFANRGIGVLSLEDILIIPISPSIATLLCDLNLSRWSVGIAIMKSDPNADKLHSVLLKQVNTATNMLNQLKSYTLKFKNKDY